MLDMTISVRLPSLIQARNWYEAENAGDNKHVQLHVVSWYDQDVCVVVDCKAKKPSLRQMKKHRRTMEAVFTHIGFEVMKPLKKSKGREVLCNAY